MASSSSSDRIPSWASTHKPQTFEEKLNLLQQQKHLLQSNHKGAPYLRCLLREVKETQKRAEEQARQIQPLAFFQPSYEQALILNSWMYGIAFNCIYCANRIGKTTASIINLLLWIFPNDPKWKIFKPYKVGDPTDDPQTKSLSTPNPNQGKHVQVFPRPDISTVKLIADLAARRPITVPAPNPRLPHYHPTTNRPFLQWLQKTLAKSPSALHRSALSPTYPNPPWNTDGTIWVGAPDHDHFKNTIMPLWRQYVPKQAIERDVETDRSFTFIIDNPSSTIRKTCWEWIGKSFESKDSKWSSGAVDAIILTEGVLPSVWKEIKARFKDPGIGSHDFTPYEPANSGAATSLAQRIKKGTEPVPLPHFVFEEFSVHTAPRFIISEDKYTNLVRSYENDPEGQARLEGKFYSSSALVLSNLDRSLHLLDWDIPTLFSKFPTAQLYRGIDPGLDHPTSCAWGALLPTNQWVIYRMLCEPSLSISQRAERIIGMSNNRLAKIKWGPNPQDFYRIETHPNANSEIFTASPIDYHVFKIDETTGMNYALNYQTAGLNIVESIHTGPEERALFLDDLLRPNQYFPDIRTNTPPGPRVYFLRNSPGILSAFLKWEEFYWDRKRSGDDKGSPKDKVPSHGDDELDAVCYLTSSPFRWTRYRPSARFADDSEPEPVLADHSKQQHERLNSSEVLQSLQKQDQTQTQTQTNRQQAPSLSPAQISQQVVYFGNGPDEFREYDDPLY